MEDKEAIEIYNAYCVNPKRWKPWYTFFYVDCPQYLADNIFQKHGIKPIILKERWTEDGKYVAIFVIIKKRHMDEFLQSMYELQRNMIICGYSDYEKFCRSLDGEEEDEE